MKFFRNDGRIFGDASGRTNDAYGYPPRRRYQCFRRGGRAFGIGRCCGKFSKMPGFVSEKKVAAEVAKLLQKNAAGMCGANR